MTKHAVAGALAAATWLVSGCRTDSSASRTASAAGADLAARATVVSNDISRLEARLDAMEQEWNQIKPSMEFLRKLMDEMRYEPVVHEELIGVVTNEPATDSPAPKVDGMHP